MKDLNRIYQHFIYFEKIREKENLIAEVWYNHITHNVIYKPYTDDIFKLPFGSNHNPTYTDLEEFLTDRCFPIEQGNSKQILQSFKLDNYDPFEITKYNGGNCNEDDFYIKYTDGLVVK